MHGCGSFEVKDARLFISASITMSPSQRTILFESTRIQQQLSLPKAAPS